MKKVNLLYLFCILAQTLIAQKDLGVLRVEVTPRFAWVKVDTILMKPSEQLEQPYRFVLPSGKYQIEVWVNGFTPIVDSVLIETQKATDFVATFKYSALDPEFVTFRKEYKAYSSKKLVRDLSLGAGIASTLAPIIYMLSNPSLSQYRELTYAAQDRYRNALTPDDLFLSRRDFENYSALYEDAQKKRNTKYLIGIPVSLAAGGVTYWLQTKYKKKPLNKPVYPDKNPFVIKPLVEPGPFGLSFGINLTY